MSQMSLSLGLLKSTHKGVHEQFDFLIVAMTVQRTAFSETFLEMFSSMQQNEKDQWFKEQLDMMWTITVGSKPGFLKRRLLPYVYTLYEHFFERYIEIKRIKPGTNVSQIQLSIAQLAAQYLDEQYQRERIADICAFLKGCQ